MANPSQARIFDRALLRHRQQRAHASSRFPDFLHRLAAEDIANRFAVIKRQFATGIVFSDAETSLTEDLTLRGHIQQVLRATTLPAAAGNGAGAQIVADYEALPLGDEKLECLVSLLGLEMVNDLPGALLQIRKALKPDGLFIAAMLGGGTLGELRTAWLNAETEQIGAVTPRVAPFADIRSLGSLLQRAGFALPVVDTDQHRVRYGDALSLMREVKAMGLSNPLTERSRVPVTGELLARAASEYERLFSDPDGRVPATFQIVYLTAWAPHESQQQPLKPGSAQMRLADALSTREHSVKTEEE